MALYLADHGVPFDVAFSLPSEDLMAWSIIHGQLGGAEWDWDQMRWKEKKT